MDHNKIKELISSYYDEELDSVRNAGKSLKRWQNLRR